MIYAPLSSPIRSREYPLLSTATLAQDGQALSRGLIGQTFGATPSSATAGENFLGFLMGQSSAVPFQQVTAVKTERFTLAAGKTVTLGKTPSAATTFVYNITTSAAATPDSVTGAVVDLTTAGVVGNVYDITYRYAMTVVEARSRNGDVSPGGYAGLSTGTVSVMQAGTIYHDQFDSSKNWAAATSVKLGAAGLVTDQTGTGTTLSCSIISTPSVDYPFLGLEFSAY